jgi:uncharacterized protein with von Willebrand factor type A (vWA) domain
MFTFTPPESEKAAGFLQRCADHLSTLTPDARRKWFREWIPAVKRFPLNAELNAFALSQVILTLEGWRDLSKEAA